MNRLLLNFIYLVMLIEIFLFRKAIPLCENEGIYIRDTQSGAVSSYLGHIQQYFVVGSI